jgi:hypothetical protein
VAASRAGGENGAEALSHRDANAAGQARLHQFGLTGDNADEVFVAEARDQLREHERAAVRVPDEVEKRVVGLGVHDVLGHLGHGGVVERAEGDRLGAAAVEVLDRAEQRRRAPARAEGEDPGDRQGREADGQRAQRRCGPAVGPLQIVERDQQRPIECRALEHRLQILQQPISLLRQRVKLPKPGSVEQRVRAVEERGHQRSELDDPRAGLGGADADPERKPSRNPCRLGQQAGLAHPRLSLDEHHRPSARARTVKLDTDRREFTVPTANNGSGRRRPAHISDYTAITRVDFDGSRRRLKTSHAHAMPDERRR